MLAETPCPELSHLRVPLWINQQIQVRRPPKSGRGCCFGRKSPPVNRSISKKRNQSAPTLLHLGSFPSFSQQPISSPTQLQNTPGSTLLLDRATVSAPLDWEGWTPSREPHISSVFLKTTWEPSMTSFSKPQFPCLWHGAVECKDQRHVTDLAQPTNNNSSIRANCSYYSSV